ncbi:MAG: hypothetical protein ORO03_01850, partial [Alphaproteobacteria bacterium]|nr:hypothetical protein [Alphaproteobacteria bacterium]
MRIVTSARLLGIFGIFGLLVPLAAFAVPPDNGLQNAAKSLQDSRNQQRILSQSQEKLAAQLEGLRQSLAMAGRGALSTELTLHLLNQELQAAEAQDALLHANQRKTEQQTAELLASLQRIGLVPPLMLSYLPLTSQSRHQSRASANEVARAAILLNSSLPLLARRTQNLQAGILAIQAVERRIQNHQQAIKENSDQLGAKRRAI